MFASCRVLLFFIFMLLSCYKHMVDCSECEGFCRDEVLLSPNCVFCVTSLIYPGQEIGWWLGLVGESARCLD